MLQTGQHPVSSVNSVGLKCPLPLQTRTGMLLGAIPQPEEGLPPASTVDPSSHNTQSFLPLQM
uniref:(California timema) hypothetical protein n=1 Tax=Timema californicum TaxID=61474 RepID=A0A7R9JHS5_TIMCA|nr:unnamed protein product [Timema californicum]